MTKEGTVLDGKYEILTKVGQGGMSIVYLARDRRLNKQWAVKEIKRDGTKSEKTLLKGLEREANILKNVDHPGLPRIVDIINQDGIIYVVMDYIEGITVREKIKKEGAIPQEEVVEWGIQLASALDYLHHMNPPVIYRDMKPSNIMIKPDGNVKLIDFGTAKEYKIESNADTTALGTRGYAAPEQFGDEQGKGIYKTDARTDIYNLGATLYHMVTNNNPCEPPYGINPIREINPELSSGLEKIITKCTQPNPDDRYRNCTELIYDLEHYNEIDDRYQSRNKKKLAVFITTIVLSGMSFTVSGFGYSGLRKIKLNNYNYYIESGIQACANQSYEVGAEEFKKAIELDGSKAKAYEQYIQAYVNAEEDAAEKGEQTSMNLDDALTLVANRISSNHGGVKKNNAVLFKLAITYFEKERAYSEAAKYFGMVDKNNETYGKQAEFYETISKLRSDSSVNAVELVTEVNDFASYNEDNFTNQEPDKFVNYRIIGEIYSTNANKLNQDVLEQAAETMEQALEDLTEYTGEELEKQDTMDLNYQYDDDLITIYMQLAKLTEESPTVAYGYYQMAEGYCEDYIDILKMKMETNGITLGGASATAYDQAYYNKMMTRARCFDAQGKQNETLAVYIEAEQNFGAENTWSASVYAEHLDYLYRICEDKEQNPELWKQMIPDLTSSLIEVYDNGSRVAGIEENKTWYKRKETLLMLKNGVSQSVPVLNDEVESAEESQEGK